MRLAAYAGASTALAGAVVLRAFSERANFYSAAVYLGQSNACRLILMNFLLLTAGTTLYALQRILYGPLRPIEIEQLWDKGWYAVTETALAMTTFRDEVGGWFFILFMSLLAGKVWGWIGEGRLEILEQQPPANPRLFHARLATSLLVSELFDVLMLNYCVRTLQEQPRPGMMVMFAFEFAVLVISSSSTLARYGLALREKVVVQQQTKARVEERRREIRLQAQQQTSDEGNESRAAHPTFDEEIDENEIDVPGWQEKGRWVLVLDLITDLLKLILYVGFFFILLLFSGIPIHMFRDLYMTLRSFIKRISDYLKYRNATRDMNSRYPDATREELERDGTCIICREEMRPWDQPQQQRDAPAQPLQAASDERQRPKKLPCGHVLHIGCLRSWLERQQVCPTCRSPVVVAGSTNNIASAQADVGGGRDGQDNNNNGVAGQQVQVNNDANNNHHNNLDDALRRRAPGIRARTWGLGNFRFTLAAGNGQAIRRALQEGQIGNNGNPNNDANDVAGDLLESLRRGGSRGRNMNYSIRSHLDVLERRINSEIEALSLERHRLAYIRALQNASEALRNERANTTQSGSATPGPAPWIHATRSDPSLPAQTDNLHPGAYSGVGTSQGSSTAPSNGHESYAAGAPRPGAGIYQMPEGLVLPEGWSVSPLPSRASTPFGSASIAQPAGSTTVHVHGTAPLSQYDNSQSFAGSIPHLFAEPNTGNTSPQAAQHQSVLSHESRRQQSERMQLLNDVIGRSRQNGAINTQSQPDTDTQGQGSRGDAASNGPHIPDAQGFQAQPPGADEQEHHANANSQPAAPVASAATQSRSVQSPSQQLPDWSSALSTESTDVRSDRGQGKGKDKAPTVEDAQDEHDSV